LFPSRRLLECNVPTLAPHRSNCYFNCYPPENVWNAMCQHSHYSGEMNPGIVTIRKPFGTRCANSRTTWDKWGFCRKLPPHGRGIHRKKGFRRELPAYSRGLGPVISKCAENPSNGNSSRISSFKSYVLTMPTFLKI
jgi:hypothetical protein